MYDVKEVNKLDNKKWLQEFLESDLYDSVKDDYMCVVSSRREVELLKAALHDTVYENPRKCCQLYRILDCVPYYYIKFLLEKSPASIADIGCGINEFKNLLPNIIGIDSDKNSNYDIFDQFDEDYAKGHRENFDAVITVNTIHFSEIDTITQRILWIAGLVKPGGRGFISFNLETWLMYTKKQKIHHLFGEVPQFEDIVTFINNQIVNTGLKFLVVDWPILYYHQESDVRDNNNGNIRLVFENA